MCTMVPHSSVGEDVHIVLLAGSGDVVCNVQGCSRDASELHARAAGSLPCVELDEPIGLCVSDYIKTPARRFAGFAEYGVYKSASWKACTLLLQANRSTASISTCEVST